MSKRPNLASMPLRKSRRPSSATPPRGAQTRAGRPAAPVTVHATLIRIPRPLYLRARQLAASLELLSFNAVVQKSLEHFLEHHDA